MSITLRVLLLLSGMSASVYAVDGVTLINQATVLAAGGFPYQISQSGSYRLSGNLVSSGATAINVSTAFVTLDLNGFSISCTSCTGVPGISAGGVYITVMNGTIYGFAGTTFSPYAISFSGNGGRVDNMNIFGNGGGVLSAGDLSISNSSIMQNSLNGVWSMSGSTIVSNSRIVQNSAWGIKAILVNVTGSVIASNGGSGPSGGGGIQAGAGTVMTNIINNNFGTGVAATSGPLLYGQNSFASNSIDANSIAVSLGNNTRSGGPGSVLF